MTVNPLFAALANLTHTENGALALKSTGKSVLDFHVQAGASRWNPHAAVDAFKAAFKKNAPLAILAAFDVRNVRGGKGERSVGRAVLDELPDEVLFRLMPFVPHYGRWDDLWYFVDNDNIAADPAMYHTERARFIYTFLRDQLAADLTAERPSLLAKWMPSENASSKLARRRAMAYCTATGTTLRTYRKQLSALRAKLRVVETHMSARNWGDIVYGHVPSQAIKRYTEAFAKRDPERFAAYIAGLADGSEKINAAAIYPHEIVAKLSAATWQKLHDGAAAIAEAQWTSLPNYIADEGQRWIAVCDVSGSMMTQINPRSKTQAIHVSTAMSLYVAQRLTGAFANSVISFSARPHFIVVDRTLPLARQLQSLYADMGYNTDIQAVFDLILDRAVAYNIPTKDMPTHILIISDMEFDDPQLGKATRTPFEAIAARYAAAGYVKPTIVFWNVLMRTKHFPVSFNEKDVVLLSGFSPASLEAVFAARGLVVTPESVLLQTLMHERYGPLIEALVELYGG